MKHTYKEKGDGIGFANKVAYEYEDKKYEADIKQDDTIKILSGGVEEDGNYGKQINFKIETRNGIKKISLNQSTLNCLVKNFGEDDNEWIGKEVKVILVGRVIGGDKKIVCFLAVGNWGIDKWGELADLSEVEGIEKTEEDKVLDEINANINTN